MRPPLQHGQRVRQMLLRVDSPRTRAPATWTRLAARRQTKLAPLLPEPLLKRAHPAGRHKQRERREISSSTCRGTAIIIELHTSPRNRI
eukprot:307689-Lingulodinium_polyedra.AAC.1